MKPATSTDVAAYANVSIATVSRVINGNYPVKEDTKRRVLEAIKVLDYVPNMQARELTMRRSNAIGIIVPSFVNLFFGEIVDAIENVLQAENRSVIISCARNDKELEERCLDDLIRRNVSGIISVSPNTENISTATYEAAARKTAIVFINGYKHIKGISNIFSGEEDGTIRALSHLYERGHRRILFVGGRNSASYRIKEETYQRYMQGKGLYRPEDIIHVNAGNTIDTVETTMYTLIDHMMNMRPTAIFCCNDLMATGAINACHRMELRVPEDISIIGYDNTMLPCYSTPTITSVDQHIKELGEQAVQLLLRKINGQEPDDVYLQNTLVERESTTWVS